jgi:MFS family permease
MQKRFSQIGRRIRSLVYAAILLALAGVYLLAGGFGAVVGFSLIGDWRAWYFPGDPPVAELAITMEGMALATVIAAAALLFALGLRRDRGLLVVFIVCFTLLAVSASMPIASIVNRHIGEWSQLRAMAWRYVEIARSQGATLQEFKKPPEFRFAHWAEPVKLRAVTSGRWPTILVDFGNGGNAEFDLRSMWCTYSD